MKHGQQAAHAARSKTDVFQEILYPWNN